MNIAEEVARLQNRKATSHVEQYKDGIILVRGDKFQPTGLTMMHWENGYAWHPKPKRNLERVTDSNFWDIEAPVYGGITYSEWHGDEGADKPAVSDFIIATSGHTFGFDTCHSYRNGKPKNMEEMIVQCKALYDWMDTEEQPHEQPQS